MAKAKKKAPKRVQFDPKILTMLSPDTDDWNDLVNEFDWLNQENAIYGVLLYPRKGMSKNRIDTEVIDWICEQYSFAHGGLDTRVKQRGEDWAIIYIISAWYNHFDLTEEYD